MATLSSLIGRRLGVYDVRSLLGIGGMGEVYRARDTKLERDVAIKILPRDVADDPDRLARFEREARVLASLNHPHIGGIYGFEDAPTSDGLRVRALVLELVEGETLADRLRRGAIPAAEAMAIARQIAEALDGAHEQGLIHRDLKPANVKVTPAGVVKVLDFGLAKITTLDDEDRVTTRAAIQPGATREGVVLGTVPYMSPEQARGEPLDKRSDIWAFGVVLYEMLTGRRPFEGRTTTDTLAAIVREEPDWSRVPDRPQRLVRRCLEKDRQLRLRDLGDAMLLLEDGPAHQHPRAPAARWMWPAVAALSLTATMVLLLTREREQALAPLPVTFQIAPRAALAAGPPIVSPDGRNIAFFAESFDRPGPRLWVHSIDNGQSRELFVPGKLRQFGPPFWSPDSRSIALAADGKLSRIDLSDGAVRTVCELVRPPFVSAGAWSRDGVILFHSGILMRVSANGGTPAPVTALDPARQEIGHHIPVFLPGGRHFLYLRSSASAENTGVFVGSLDARPEEQDLTRLVATRAGPVYAPSTTGRGGHLLFLRDASLMAQPFDPAGLTLTGDAVSIVERVAFPDVPFARFAHVSVSETGVLAYRHREVVRATPVWMDRNGRELAPLVSTPLERPEHPRFSPDGRRLALIVAGDLWVYNLDGRPPIKLTSDASKDTPLWTPDGKQLVFSSNVPPHHLLSVQADGSGKAPRRVSPDGHYHAHGWSRDGRDLIAVLNTYSATTWDILRIPVGGEHAPQPVAQTAVVEGIGGAALSPDGRWLAYTCGQGDLPGPRLTPGHSRGNTRKRLGRT